MDYFNLVFNSAFQILLFTLIPLVWWLLISKREAGFFSWIGIKKPVITNKSKYLIVFIGILGFMPLAFLLISIFLQNSSDLATAQFTGLGISFIPAAFIYGFLQTGLPEEILFRGFLTKRFISRYGFLKGNNIQAVIFGAVHGILFFSLYSWYWVIIIITYSAIIGWLMGYMNEKLSSGSIISSWLAHGMVNTLMAFITMMGVIG